ncbi:DUF4105 domain-containing protein [Geojedonia litorea]|uniref:DUF4105 domain-containing protein n=1 Tax=Geojedonia litorea TaxID=1268269 RepID=A0ABV9N1B2_9FLAO
MKLKLLFALLFVCVTSSFAQFNLSPNAEISVLTIGPGTELNDAFGHNAFRIKDTAQGLDITYGYGEYDFDAPNFYLKFAQGKLNYLVSRVDFNRLYNFYVYQNRTISEQVLNLSTIEQQKLFDFLQENYQPENRGYLYDFFYDNCATKMRDVLLKVVEAPITFHTPSNLEPKSFRALIHEHVNRNSWGSLGIDTALGAVIDEEATPYEYMFLPKYIFRFFAVATKNGEEPLVKTTTTLFEARTVEHQTSIVTSPLFIMTLLALLILWITYRDYKSQTRTKSLDLILFGLTGLIGMFVLLLWLATDHTATAQNYNLLWAFPLNLLMLLPLSKPKLGTRGRKYLKFLIIMLVLLTMHWFIGIQVFAIGWIPLLIALGIRYIYLLKFNS